MDWPPLIAVAATRASRLPTGLAKISAYDMTALASEKMDRPGEEAVGNRGVDDTSPKIASALDAASC